MTEPISVRAEDGWRLQGVRHPGDGPVVVCGHAMMVDRRTLDRPRGGGLLSALAAAGLDVVAFDVRGHGESGPSADEGGRWRYDDIVRFDVPAMVRRGRELAAGRPVIVLGHSLVSHAALIAAGLSDPPDALVALAPNLWTPSLEPRLLARCAKGATLRIWHAATRLRGYWDAPGLGQGTDAEAEPYVRQFVEMWRADRLGYEDALARATLPVLAYSSRADRLLAHPAAVERFLALSAADVEHRVVDDLSHMGLVTDPRARPLWDACAAWIRQR